VKDFWWNLHELHLFESAEYAKWKIEKKDLSLERKKKGKTERQRGC
jgi:hypothetical protein